MVELEIFPRNDRFRNLVAQSAFGRTGTRLLVLEVTQGAGRLCHRYVASLDNL